MEEVLELLNGCGLTTPAQIRRVVLCNPQLLFYRSERNVKSKLSFLRTFMLEEDISKLVSNYALIFNSREDKLKSATSLLQRLGVEGKALSHLVVRQPLLMRTSEEKVMESFKQAETLGFKKGSKLFAVAMRAFLGLGKEKLERKLHCLSGLGFSNEHISELSRREPRILGLSEEKLKRNVDFVVNSAGLSLADLLKYPQLFSLSLEKRIIPRYRVIEALKSIQVQEVKRETTLRDMVQLTEKNFLDIYHGAKAGKLIIDKEKH